MPRKNVYFTSGRQTKKKRKKNIRPRFHSHNGTQPAEKMAKKNDAPQTESISLKKSLMHVHLNIIP